MRRYLIAGLIAVAMAAAAWGVVEIGDDDGRNNDGSDPGSLRRWDRAGVVHVGYPLPDWPQRTPTSTPAPTPTPAPAATPSPADGPEPGPPEPRADAAAASPAETGTAPEREPQPEPAGERPTLDPEGIPAGPEALLDDPVEIIHQVFGQNAGAALAVAHCETGGTFDPGMVGAAGERGLFQIHPIHFSKLDADRLYEPRYNAEVAYGMSAGGTDWGPWRNCQP